MTQDQRLNVLLHCLLAERKEYEDIPMPDSLPEKRRILRSLMNVRPPIPAREDFLRMQDAYLKERLAERGVTRLKELTPVRPGLYLWQGDITTLRCDAIVNAANSQLLAGSGVCGAIFRAAGTRAEELQRECLAKAPCPTGHSVLTGSYGLPARYIIHTVGPIWQGGNQGEEALLASCYRSALTLAWEAHCRSIAFPLISSGIFGYPKRAALLTAREAITQFLEDYEEMEVYLALLDRSAVELGEKLEKGLEHFVDTYCRPDSRKRGQTEIVVEAFQVLSLEHALPSAPSRSLEDDVKHLTESFSRQLFRFS